MTHDKYYNNKFFNLDSWKICINVLFK